MNNLIKHTNSCDINQYSLTEEELVSISNISSEGQHQIVRILFFSKYYERSAKIFELITHQLNSNWDVTHTDKIKVVLEQMYRREIDIILIYQNSFNLEELNTFAPQFRLQTDTPILAIVEQEDVAIASITFSFGAQDYLTLEELLDKKILERSLWHTFIKSYNLQENTSKLTGSFRDCISQDVEEDFLEREDTLLGICDYLPIGIFQTDPVGNPIYINKFLKKIGSSSIEFDKNKSWLRYFHNDDQIYLKSIGALGTEELLVHDWMNFIHPDDQWKVIQLFNEFVKSKNLFNIEFRMIFSQDNIRWFKSQGTTLLDSNKKIISHICTVTDITSYKETEKILKQLNRQQENQVLKRTLDIQQANLKLRIENKIRRFHESGRERVEQELQAAKEQLQAVLDAVPSNISWVNLDCDFLGFNQQMIKNFQLKPENLIGKNVKHLDKKFANYIKFVEKFINANELTSSLELEIKGNKKNKNYLLIGQKYAKCQAAVFVAIDITNLKQAELETHRALETTRELSDLKSRFIFMASHEFRTPLTSILSASELLENYGAKWPPEKNLKYLKQIQDSVRGMTNLLEDILIIGSEAAGKLKIQPIELDIVSFCQSLIEEYELDRNNCNHFHFSHDTQLRIVLIDSKLLRHILTNLLSNAIKYSLETASIYIKLYTDYEQIVIQVIDQGIGIPQEDQKDIFDLFHRSSNVGTIRGTGIGLSIVKKSLDALGGSISFESKLQSGTQFTISIPITQNVKDYQW